MKITREKLADIAVERDKKLREVEKRIVNVLEPFDSETRLRILKAIAVLHGLDVEAIFGQPR